MKTLHFGCSCTDAWVSPQNWRTVTSQASLKKSWYVQCNFFDPRFADKYPRGFGFRKKLNKVKGLDARKAAAEFMLQEIPKLLEERGYNPITGEYMIPEPVPEPAEEIVSMDPTITPTEVFPETPIINALKFALKNAEIAESTKGEIDSILVHVETALRRLKYHKWPIKDFTRKHVRYMISKMEEIGGAFSGHKFNKYRAYLSILFGVLMEYEAVESNIIKDIKKRPQISNVRDILSLEERFYVNKHLKEYHYSFWIFTHIFFHSGGRITEQISIRYDDVDLDNQKYRVFIKKGKLYMWVERVIKDVALPYWEEALRNGKPGDFLFSNGLVPGPRKIRRDQINRRWKAHVKDKLGITADFYSLKHINLDETAEILSLKDAAAMANHKDTKMVRTVYAVGESARQAERLKLVHNNFA